MKPWHTLGYPTKAAALAELRAIIANASSGSPLEGEACTLALKVLALHPSARTKIGAGVAFVYVGPVPGYPKQRCLWVQRRDGTKTDFSFHEALAPSSMRLKRMRAARAAVQDQIAAYRSLASKSCQSCTAPADHVDHCQRPFVFLYEAWEQGLGGREPPLRPTVDASSDERFADRADEESWCAYHRAHATLQMLCAHCNLSKGCR